MPKTSRRLRGEPRAMMRALLLLLIAALTVGILPGLTAQPARAATLGDHITIGGWGIGTFVSSYDGSHVYCVEPAAVIPNGDQRNPGWVEELRGYSVDATEPLTGWRGTVTSGPASGDALRRMNYLMTNYRHPGNAEESAAVQLAIWMVRGDPGVQAWLDHHIRWIANGGYPGVVERARQLAAEAIANAHAPRVAAPEALTIAQTEHGEGTVAHAAGATELRITGGTFENGERTLNISHGRAGTVAWKADLHPNGWQRLHEVRVEGDWAREAQGWAAALRLHPPAVGNEQALGDGVGLVTEVHTGRFAAVRTVVDAQFAPVLSTQTPEQFVAQGSGSFADTVTFGVAEGSAPWAQRDGENGVEEYAPVVAQGVLYGPFTHPQDPADEPPRSAPVAARAELVADRGPGEYAVTASEPVDEAGYYYWVWQVRETEQREEIREAELLPEDYRFADRFGLAAEGQTVPTSLRWSTVLTERELALDRLVLRDRVTPWLEHGAWLRDAAGERIPAKLRLTVYQSDDEPVRSADVPGDAREVTHSFVTVGAPKEVVVADDMLLPFETRGWVTVRTCLLNEDQPEDVQGHFEEWCDDYGIPEETARIVLPEVRTEAQPDAVVGDEVHDTAFVEGVVPGGSTLGFTLYLRPEAGDVKYGDDWKPVLNGDGRALHWNEEEIAALSEEERCLAQPVAVTERVEVPGAGSVRSPAVQTRSAGTGYWVEDLAMPHPETGESVELHRGACGLENERTVIREPGDALAATGAGWISASAVLGLGAMLVLIGLGAVVNPRLRRGAEGWRTRGEQENAPQE